MQTKLETFQQDNKLVIKIPKEFDGFCVDKVRDELERLGELNTPTLCLDFSETIFVDSSGIGAIVFLYKRLLKQNRDLILDHVDGQPQKLMSMLHVDRTIQVNKASSNIQETSYA